MTHAPSDRIRPLCSASGMNTAGLTSPRCGWCQRSSASTPVIWPLGACTFGW